MHVYEFRHHPDFENVGMLMWLKPGTPGVLRAFVVVFGF
jgi:hypothetical protein